MPTFQCLSASHLTQHPTPPQLNTLYAGMTKIAHKEWYGYKTDLEIWRENRLARMYLRGNPPTKKGEGKRAKQKKK